MQPRHAAYQPVMRAEARSERYQHAIAAASQGMPSRRGRGYEYTRCQLATHSATRCHLFAGHHHDITPPPASPFKQASRPRR